MKSLRCGVAMHWSRRWRLARPALRLRAPGRIGLGSHPVFRLPLANFCDALRVRHLETGSAGLIVKVWKRDAW
jgi:hypothetical protein